MQEKVWKGRKDYERVGNVLNKVRKCLKKYEEV